MISPDIALYAHSVAPVIVLATLNFFLEYMLSKLIKNKHLN